MRKWPLLILTAAIVIAGCNSDPDTGTGNQTNQPTLHRSEMPADMPADFDFTVSYGYGEVNKNEINTFDDTVTKDLVVKGTANTELALTDEEMKMIYRKMIDIDIMGKKTLAVKPASAETCMQTPYHEDSWTITAAGETKSMSWSSEHCEITDDARQLSELRQYIRKIVENKEAYKALPEAEGGYD